MSVSKAVQNVTKAPKGVTDFHLATTVTDDVLKALKFSCRNDSKSIDDAARCLLLDLASRSAIVRLRSLSVIDSLFLRSKEFRKRISVNIRSIAECAGFLGGKHLDNVEHRNILEHRVKEMLEMWDMYYGDFLPEIRALVRHMKEFLHLVMPDIKARALQHATELDKKQRISENKILAKGHQVLAELRSNGVQSLSVPEIRSSLSELNSCFNILFPGVTDFGSDPRYHPVREMTIPLDVGDCILSSSSLSAAPAASILWECDGQEVDDPEYVNELSDNDDKNDVADDNEDVAWEDAVDDENSTDHGDYDDDINDDNVTMDMNMTPFTLEIRLPMTASGIETCDNAIIMQTLREITNHLTIHALPILREWREALSAALGCYNHAHQSGSGREMSSNKRKRDSHTLCNEDNTISSGINLSGSTDRAQEEKKLKFIGALREVCALDDEVHRILRTRCKTLLISKNTDIDTVP